MWSRRAHECHANRAVGGLLETIDAGRTGHLVPSGDVAALAEGVLTLLCVSDAKLPLVTPPLTVRLVRLRLPLGENVIDLSSEDADADPDGAPARAPGVTT